jgi:signal transduction histidine kinase
VGAAEHEDTSIDDADGAQRRRDEPAEHGLRADLEALRRRVRSLEITCDRQRALYERTPTPHLTIGPDRVIVDLNAAAEALLGVPRASLLATTIDALIPPGARERLAALIDALFAGEHARPIELVLPRPALLPLDISLDGVPLPAAGDEPARVVLAVVDHTARQVAEAARRKAQDEVMAIVSHDLRGPISSIGLACDGLGADLPAEEQDECLAAIRRAVVRSERLIDDLLRVAHLESGRLALDVARFDVRKLVAHVCRDHQRAASAAGSRLTTTLGDEASMIDGDRERLHQVLSNLLRNAFVHARGSAVEVSVAPTDAGVMIAVADDGPGIPAAELPFVFERYRQGARRRGGAGLGLAIVKGLVEAHHGTVSVTTTLGHGARFAIVLPRSAPGV